MTEFKIEKGVPVPRERSAVTKYPFADMQPGDSFVVPREKYASVKALSVKHQRSGLGQFTVRSVEGGVRVWRVA